MAKQKAKENKIIDQLVVLQDKVARKKLLIQIFGLCFRLSRKLFETLITKSIPPGSLFNLSS